ncbi:MAG: hypothetical protein V4793_05400 [Paraburkholderia tropica]
MDTKKLWSATPAGIACREAFEAEQGRPRFNTRFNPTTEQYHDDHGIGPLDFATNVEWDLWRKSWLAALHSDAAGASAMPVELRGVEDALKNEYGFWRSCSGCHDTEDGHDVGHYDHSAVMNCTLGAGCSECGGIGAVWDNTDYEDMGNWIERRETEAKAAVEKIMEQVQVFASAWSLVGGPFDSGNGLEAAEQEKAKLRAMLDAAPPPTVAADAAASSAFLSLGEFDPDHPLLAKAAQPDERAADAAAPSDTRFTHPGCEVCACPPGVCQAEAAQPQDAFRQRVERLLVQLHNEDRLSEGQCAKVLDIHRIAWRKMADEAALDEPAIVRPDDLLERPHAERSRAEGGFADSSCQRNTPDTTGDTDELTREQDEDRLEARAILTNMLQSIEQHGPYSTETTCRFLRQAIQCLPVAPRNDRA